MSAETHYKTSANCSKYKQFYVQNAGLKIGLKNAQDFSQNKVS